MFLLGCSVDSNNKTNEQTDDRTEVTKKDVPGKCSLRIELVDDQNNKVDVQREPLGDPYIRLVKVDENLIRYPGSSEPQLFKDVTEGSIAITVGKGEKIEALHKEDLKCEGESSKTIQIKTGNYVAQTKVDSAPKAISMKQPMILSNVKKVERTPKTINVGVIVNEEGNVISARLMDGDKEFQSFKAMEEAAVKSTFERPLLNGKPTEYSSVVAYNYVP